MSAKFSFVFTMAVLGLSTATLNPTPGINCNIQRRCNTQLSRPVFATSTGSDCIVYQNQCFFENAYCNYQKSQPCHAVKLRPITREQCSSSTPCNLFCTLDYTPVCAEFLGHRGTFSNSCNLNGHICRSGEAWQRISGGECGPLIA